MKLNDVQNDIWKIVQSELEKEPVASPDHVERMTTWCQKLGPQEGVDMEILTVGALVHDVGVPINRPNHFSVGREKAAEILNAVDFQKDKIEPALHVLEAHSRYGGPDPKTIEAKVGQDADALEYIGAIGILRMVIRGLTDESFDGRISDFPEYFRKILSKVEDTFHTRDAEQIGLARIEYMKRFLERIEKELNYEA